MSTASIRVPPKGGGPPGRGLPHPAPPARRSTARLSRWSLPVQASTRRPRWAATAGGWELVASRRVRATARPRARDEQVHVPVGSREGQHRLLAQRAQRGRAGAALVQARRLGGGAGQPVHDVEPAVGPRPRQPQATGGSRRRRGQGGGGGVLAAGAGVRAAVAEGPLLADVHRVVGPRQVQAPIAARPGQVEHIPRRGQRRARSTTAPGAPRPPPGRTAPRIAATSSPPPPLRHTIRPLGFRIPRPAGGGPPPAGPPPPVPVATAQSRPVAFTRR